MDNDTFFDGELVFTVDFDVMYSVANLENDDDFIKVFVYNQAGRNEEVSKYGRFFVITAKGCFLINNDGFEACSMHDALVFVSSEPEHYIDKYTKWIRDTNFDRFNETDFLSLHNL